MEFFTVVLLVLHFSHIFQSGKVGKEIEMSTAPAYLR